MNSLFVVTLGDVIDLGFVGVIIFIALCLYGYVACCEAIKKWKKK